MWSALWPTAVTARGGAELARDHHAAGRTCDREGWGVHCPRGAPVRQPPEHAVGCGGDGGGAMTQAPPVAARGCVWVRQGWSNAKVSVLE